MPKRLIIPGVTPPLDPKNASLEEIAAEINALSGDMFDVVDKNTYVVSKADCDQDGTLDTAIKVQLVIPPDNDVATGSDMVHIEQAGNLIIITSDQAWAFAKAVQLVMKRWDEYAEELEDEA